MWTRKIVRDLPFVMIAHRANYIAAAVMGKSPPRAGKGNKLMKILGAEAPQHYISKLNAEQKPWYLRPNYDQSEILIDPDGGVRAGTPAALVERATAHEHGGELVMLSIL